MSENPQIPELASTLRGILKDVCASIPALDWNAREALAYETVSRFLIAAKGATLASEDVYFGGDSLRPYLTVSFNNQVWLVSRERPGLTRPRLVTEFDSGMFGPVRTVFGEPGLPGEFIRLISAGSLTSERLLVPKVYLTSLTNPSRYQTRRYPLNVGRLAQWLRFQHASRVLVADLALDFDGNVEDLFDDILSFKPDIVGISLNFGEFESLRELISLIRNANVRPIICLGNVLAAWAPEEATRICTGFELHISSSYGESDLEQLCLSFRKTLQLSADRNDQSIHWPTAIVLPDERLLADTLKQGGQVSIETSFGCQFSGCSFCPRSHRGKEWKRPAPQDSLAVVDSVASHVSGSNGERSGVLSFVDEEAFGEEGINGGDREPLIAKLVSTAGSHQVACEIYTRVEQIFDRQRKAAESLRRLQLLSQMMPALARVFVGVESGSDSQLQRYGKGQTTRDVVDALRAGSLLGLPLEFGFITFDPLLTQSEIVENLEFLAREDILLTPSPELGIEDICALVVSNDVSALPLGDPIFNHIAYMATELELFANSSFFRRLSYAHPHLLGQYDSSFARYDYSYQDPTVGEIASWCRVWTEGTFKPVYRIRLASRALKGSSTPFHSIIRKYREATFNLLLALTSRFSTDFRTRVTRLLTTRQGKPLVEFQDADITLNDLGQLWEWIVSGPAAAVITEHPQFNLDSLEHRRAT